MSKKYLDIRIVGFETEINEFIELCSVIQKLCDSGSSRDILVNVDGDGSANLSFYPISNGELRDRIVSANIDIDNIPRLSIGE